MKLRHPVLVLLVLGACKKKPPEAPPEPIDPFSQESLEAWRDELVPVLEKHAQRSFSAPPKVAVFDPRAFEDFLRQETELILQATLNDTPEEVRTRAAAERRALGGLFGKYGLYDQTTYVVPESIQRAAREAEVDATELGKVVLVHELAHALQNELVPPEPVLGRIVDLDHFHCWSAVSEGGANWLALQVVREIGIEEAFWELTQFQGWSREGLEEPRAYPVWMSYGKGMETLDQVVQDGGIEAFWTWHAHPPASSSMLFAPETYSADPPTRAADFASVLRGTEQLLTRGDWLVSNTRLGEYDLRGDAIRTNKEAEFEDVLAHLIDAQNLNLEMRGRGGNIGILRFDSPDAARAYVTLLRAEQTVEGQFLAKAMGVTVEVTYSEVQGVEGDASLLRTQRVPMGTSYKESRTAWVARGNDIVTVTATDFRPGLRLANTLNGVFERLEQSEDGAPPDNTRDDND